MQTDAEAMRKTKDESDLQRLYADVSRLTNYMIEKNKDLEKQLLSFRADVHDLIHALHAPPKAIPSAMLPRTLVPLINKLLTVKSEDAFEKIRLPELFADPTMALDKIKKLFQLCKNEPFKSIMRDLLDEFTNKYLKRFDLEAMRIYKEERAIQSAIDNPISPPEHKEKLKKELVDLAKHSAKIRASFFAEKKFFDHYSLRDFGYITEVSFSFDSLQNSAKKLVAASASPQLEQQASLAKKSKLQ